MGDRKAGRMDETARKVKAETKEAAGSWAGAARENIVPLAVIGGAVTWMLVERFRGHEPSHQARAGAGAAAETARHTMDAARETGRQAQSRLQRLVNENPLMVGAAAMVAGAAVGLAIPETEREHALMGETRDRIVERAKEAARQKVRQVRGAAGEVTSGLVGSGARSGNEERGSQGGPQQGGPPQERG